MWSPRCAQHAQQIERTIVEIVGRARSAARARTDAAHDLSAELSGQLDYWRDVRRRLHACVHEPARAGARSVHSLYGRGRTPFRAAWLNAAPHRRRRPAARPTVRRHPTPRCWSRPRWPLAARSITSRSRLGLEDAAAHALGSPFDYASARPCCTCPTTCPTRISPGYQALLERTILDVVTRLRGRTLVLFTSRAHLKATYQALREQLAAQRHHAAGQGIDETSRTRLLETFRRGSRVALFGTNAFWEGIDVVGEALSCVMVTRLPFAVPTDPVYAARAEQFEQPFSEYAVPQAVLRLKQGFGRLIRSRAGPRRGGRAGSTPGDALLRSGVRALAAAVFCQAGTRRARRAGGRQLAAGARARAADPGASRSLRGAPGSAVAALLSSADSATADCSIAAARSARASSLACSVASGWPRATRSPTLASARRRPPGRWGRLCVRGRRPARCLRGRRSARRARAR